MKLKHLAFAAAVAVSSAAVHAEDFNRTVPLVENASLPGFFTAGFSVEHLVAGAFTDTFTFSPNIPEGSFVSSRLVTGGFTDQTRLNFSSASLDGTSFNFQSIGLEQVGFSGLLSNVGGALQLTVSGVAGPAFASGSPIAASYSGTINVAPGTVAPIPEPETYALMLAGLAAVGFVARRRRRQ